MKGQSYVGNDPYSIPSLTGKDAHELQVLNGAMSWGPLRVNPNTINVDTIVPTGVNATMAGPVTLNAVLEIQGDAVVVVV